MSKPKPFVSEKKKKEVKVLVKLIQDYPIVGLVDMTSMPTLQLQRMRDSLRGKVLIRMSKKPLIKLALEKCGKKGIEGLIERIKGMPALILAKDNPFVLANILKKSKSKAPAKPGQEAPNDIVVPAGATLFSPGPIIGELGSAGIKAGIEGGKVVIKADSLVVKEGQRISASLAGLLARLGIEPMDVGLNLVGVYEDGFIFGKDVLEVDEVAYIENIKVCVRDAFNLAFSVGYPTKENIKFLILKAYRDSEGLADSCNIFTSSNVGKVLAKAEQHMESIKSKVNN